MSEPPPKEPELIRLSRIRMLLNPLKKPEPRVEIPTRGFKKGRKSLKTLPPIRLKTTHR